ncbi:MAG: S-layer homology domain-containing protein [Oscillospiraceae bacterium]|nr:S-layer homology domain-containing protein [Oscillospiraceae bacterium]
MKRCLTLLVTLIFCLSLFIFVLSVGNPAFSVKIDGALDTTASFNGQSTLVLDWQIMANREGLSLRNTQGLRLTYDNTVLQLMKWDGSDVIDDSATGTSFSVISQVGRAGAYNTALRVSAAKDAVGNIGYLNISLGSAFEAFACPQGVFVTLSQVRLAFRPGKTIADLTGDSISCMNASELAATAQSSAVLINTTENEITSYEYMRQENGVAIGGDKLNAPTIDYPLGNPTNDDPPTEPPPTDTDAPPDTTEPEAPSGSTQPDTSPILTDPEMPSDYENPYIDIATNDWFYNAVKYVTEQGLMNGVGSNKFSPDVPMSRAMFATVLYRLAGLPGVSGHSAFSDVVGGQWYTDAVQWASENGIILGYGDGSFGTNDNITREQAVTMLYRYSEVMGLDISAQADLSKYSDASKISDWAQNGMRWAVGAGIVSGRSPTTLAPQGQITRAEVAQLLLNYS